MLGTFFKRAVFGGLLGLVATMSFAQVALVDASMRGDADTVRQLVQSGANVNAEQADGATALHWAAYHADQSLAEFLLEAGANPDKANRNGQRLFGWLPHAAMPE